ncbi:hypothetical protein J6590_022618 [Homalodisca vitripennis]|nr:hypothetical protein J6590_022618 [Homalodisca vitripennis]
MIERHFISRNLLKSRRFGERVNKEQSEQEIREIVAIPVMAGPCRLKLAAMFGRGLKTLKFFSVDDMCDSYRSLAVGPAGSIRTSSRPASPRYPGQDRHGTLLTFNPPLSISSDS